MLETFERLGNRLRKPWKRAAARRSLALPPRTGRPTRVFTDPSVESRGRHPIIDPKYAAYWAALPLDAEHVQAALRGIDERIAYWERRLTSDDHWCRSERGRRETSAGLARFRDERATLLGLENAARFIPSHEFVARHPPAGENGLLGAALRAHEEHQGLVLAPEAFLATVAQGVARFIFEGDRAKIPDDQRTELEVLVFATGPFASTSAAAIAEELSLMLIGRDALAARLNGVLGPLRAATGYAPLTDITLLAAFDARYRYIVGLYACGIRRIEVEGKPDEWLRAMWAARGLREMPELEPLRPWLTTVGEIAHRIAGGDPSDAASQRFLGRIVEYDSPSCSPGYATGWITNLFPYYRGKLRTEFPVEGGPKLAVWDQGLNDHLLAKARVRVVPQPPCPGEPFDIQLVAGLDVQEEPCGDMTIYRPVPFHGLWAPLRQ